MMTASLAVIIRALKNRRVLAVIGLICARSAPDMLSVPTLLQSSHRRCSAA